MKDSARYLTTRIREERIRDYASVTSILATKSVTLTIIGPCAARATAFSPSLEICYAAKSSKSSISGLQAQSS
jgi:hypothetical protein